MAKKCRDPMFCPVANLRLYIDLCNLMSIDLRVGYLFRSTDKKGTVTGKPFIGSAIANRLTLHLETLGIHNGETMHSFRSGCSIHHGPHRSYSRRCIKVCELEIFTDG